MPRRNIKCDSCKDRLLTRDRCVRCFSHYGYDCHKWCCDDQVYHGYPPKPKGKNVPENQERSEFSTTKIAMQPERACKVCRLPEYMLQDAKCRADNNDGVEAAKKRQCGRKNKNGDWVGGCGKTHGKICENDKNPVVQWGHIIVDTGSQAPVPVLSGKGEFKINPIKRLVGYEIEVAEYYDGQKISAFAREIGAGMVHDEAFEMNTPPANGDKLVERTKLISETIRKYGAKCRGSGCGLHTHVDIRDANYADVRKIIILYGKTEGALYSIIDPRRATNGMCKPMGGQGLVNMMMDYDNYKENIQRIVYGGTTGKGGGGRGRNKDPMGGDRYLGFNLHSWWMRGTIEFRMHHGTTKFDKMINWGLLLAGMCDAGVKRSDKEIDNWPTGLAGMLAYAPTEDCKKWVQERWDYFASKRKAKGAILPDTNTKPTSNDNPEEDYEG